MAKQNKKISKNGNGAGNRNVAGNHAENKSQNSKKTENSTLHTPGRSVYMETERKKKVDVWRIKPYLAQSKKINIYTGKKIIVLNEREAH